MSWSQGFTLQPTPDWNSVSNLKLSPIFLSEVHQVFLLSGVVTHHAWLIKIYIKIIVCYSYIDWYL